MISCGLVITEPTTTLKAPSSITRFAFAGVLILPSAMTQSQVDLPIIGIVKRDYADSEVYITPTMKEVDELMEIGPEIIALDATGAPRPGLCHLRSLLTACSIRL